MDDVTPAPAGLRIDVFTASRGDLGPLGPVIEALHADPRCRPRVLAAGTHTSRSYGATFVDRGTPVVRLDVGLGSIDDAAALTEVVAATALTVSAALVDDRPDLLVVLGDRYELIGAVAAATLHGVPVAHLHGGEVSEGAIDDAVRHAVTKLSHLHLVAAEEHARRVRQLGEEPWRVRVVGAPGLDRLREVAARQSPDAALARVAHVLGGPVERPLGLLTYHQPTLTADTARAELEALLSATDLLGTTIVTWPGSDPESRWIIDRVEQARGGRIRVVEGLGPDYPVALRAADLVLGNSSSGIVEAPALGVPTVNVGLRQQGRTRSASVIDVDASGVRAAVASALAEQPVRPRDRLVDNPYGDGHASERIVKALTEAPISLLLRKRFVDLPPGTHP